MSKMPRVCFFLLLISNCLAVLASDVSLTVTGVLPEITIIHPNSIFFSSSIELDPLDKRELKIFPDPPLKATISKTIDIVTTIEIHSKKHYKIEANEAKKYFKIKTDSEIHIENDLNPLIKKKFVFRYKEVEYSLKEIAEVDLWNNSRRNLYLGNTKNRRFSFSYPYLNLSDISYDDFVFERRNTDLLSKKKYRSKNEIIFGINQDRNFSFEFEGEMFSIKKHFDNYFSMDLKLSDAIFSYEFSENFLSSSAKTEEYDINFSIMKDNFKAYIKRDGIISDNLSLGAALFNTTPIPLIRWNWFDNGLFSIGLDTFSYDSYGAVFDFFLFPYSVSLDAGMNIYKKSLNVTGSLSATIDSLNTGIELSGGYHDFYFIDLSFNNHSISFNDFNMDIFGNIGYNEGLYLGVGTRVEASDFILKLNVNYESGGILFNVEAGIEF